LSKIEHSYWKCFQTETERNDTIGIPPAGSEIWNVRNY